MGARTQLRDVRAEMDVLREEVAQARLAGALTARDPHADLPQQPPERRQPRRMRSAVHRHSGQIRPLAVLAALEGTGSIGHGMGLGAWATIAGLGVGTAWWLRRSWKLDRTPERVYALTSWLAACGWLGHAATAGVTHVDTRLWVVGAGLSVPWWVHHRIRPRLLDDEATTVDWTHEVLAQWDARVACSHGPLPSSRLLELHRLDDDSSWQATIEVHDGNADAAIARWKDIGARLKLRIDEIDVEPHSDGLHLARILVRRGDNPLLETRRLLEPTFDAVTGRSIIAFYADGKPVVYRHYRRGSGPIHDLFSGCTRSGKTELAKTLLGEERRSGVIVSWLLDPQRGQSYGVWKKRVHRFAGTKREIRDALRDLKRRMEARSELLSSIVWRDEKGREQEGITDFTPGDPRHGLPMISVTIDEFQSVVGDEDYGDECASLVEEMIEMSSKCGIKFRLLTPVPLMDSIGNSQRIKDAVGSGNVGVFRTANQLTGQAAFNGVMPVDPCELPKEWPNGESTAGLGFVFGPGADRPTKMRTVVLHDHYEWATTGTPAVEDDVIAPEPEQPQQADQLLEPGLDAADAVELTVHHGIPDDEEDEPADDKHVAKDHVLAYFADGAEHLPVDVKKHFHKVGIAPRTVGKALRDLTNEGLLEHPKERGPYWLSETGRAALTRRNTA